MFLATDFRWQRARRERSRIEPRIYTVDSPSEPLLNRLAADGLESRRQSGAGTGGAMRGKLGGDGGDGDGSVYAVGVNDEIERQPLLDLRTRLVLWLLCLAFLGLVYWGIRPPGI